MSNAPKRVPVFDGELVRVPLQDGTEAVTTREGYGRAVAAGFAGTWLAVWDGRSWDGERKRICVCASLPHQTLQTMRSCMRSVGKVIAGAGPKQKVHFCDGNQRNLRPENLEVCDGGSFARPKPSEASLPAAPADWYESAHDLAAAKAQA